MKQTLDSIHRGLDGLVNKDVVAVVSGCLKPYFYFLLGCDAGLDSLQQGTKSLHGVGDGEHI